MWVSRINVAAVRLCPLLAQSGHGLVHRTMSAFGGKADDTMRRVSVRSPNQRGELIALTAEARM